MQDLTPRVNTIFGSALEDIRSEARSLARAEKAATPCARSRTSSASATAPSAADSPRKNTTTRRAVAKQDLTPRKTGRLRLSPS
jgi:hypothetical protein